MDHRSRSRFQGEFATPLRAETERNEVQPVAQDARVPFVCVRHRGTTRHRTDALVGDQPLRWQTGWPPDPPQVRVARANARWPARLGRAPGGASIAYRGGPE